VGIDERAADARTTNGMAVDVELTRRRFTLDE